MAVEGYSSSLDIFEQPIVQTGVIDGDWLQYKPVNTISDTTPLVFFIPGHGDKYTDLGRTFLNIRAQITRPDGTLFDLETKVAPVNNFFHSIFNDIKVEFNQKVVSTSAHTYHYRAYLENLFNYNETAKDTHLTAGLWDQDLAGEMNSMISAPINNRNAYVAGGRIVDLAGRLHCDLFSQRKYIINEIDIRITLTKNLPEISLMAAAGTLAKVKILDATLFLRKVTINPSVLLAHTRTLNTYTAKYPYKRVEIQTVNFNVGSRQQAIENIFLGRIPSRIIVGFVLNEAFSGNVTQNPFNFQNFGLNYLSLVVNGQQLTSKPLVPNFDAPEGSSYMASYISTFFGCGIHLSDDGYTVDRDEYPDGYMLHVFDLTPDLSASESYFCLQKEGNVRLEVSFTDALADAVTCILYAEYREVLEIDKNRQCSIDYKSSF